METTIPSACFDQGTEPTMVARRREIRHKISAEFGRGPRRLMARYIEMEVDSTVLHGGAKGK